jgi:hypothetical protein
MTTRDYLPQIGRFSTRDVLYGEVGDPPSLNQFVYAGGSPVTYWDPLGMKGKVGGCDSCEVNDPPTPSGDGSSHSDTEGEPSTQTESQSSRAARSDDKTTFIQSALLESGLQAQEVITEGATKYADIRTYISRRIADGDASAEIVRKANHRFGRIQVRNAVMDGVARGLQGFATLATFLNTARTDGVGAAAAEAGAEIAFGRVVSAGGTPSAATANGVLVGSLLVHALVVGPDRFFWELGAMAGAWPATPDPTCAQYTPGYGCTAVRA